MALSVRTLTVGIALIMLTSALPILGAGVDAPVTTLSSAPATSHHVVEAHDGVAIAITVHRPAGATADDPVPLILHSHGWSGSRAKTLEGRVGDLVAAGYGVISMDMRGHGESGGVARVHSVDHEIKDVSTVLDWAYDNLDWVQKEDDVTGIPKDLRVGGAGGSYGGGWQLLAAAFDDRLDVLVPEVTWNDLPYALAPNGAVKSNWVHILYGAGKARARLDPMMDEAYQEGMLTNEIPSDILARFEASSPKTYAGEIDVPTLLVQGTMDTLFNLNQALWNFEMIEATGAPVKLVTHNEEHAGIPLSKEYATARLQGALQPCGDVGAKALAWYDHYLKGDAGVDTGATVEFAMDNGSCLTADHPDDLATGMAFSWEGPLVVSGTTIFPAAVGGVGFAGVPHLEAMVLNTCSPFTIYASVVAVGPEGVRVLSSQATPYRGGTQPGELCPMVTHLPVSFDLGGVGSVLRPGEFATLRLDLVNEHYATNSERAPQAVVLQDITLSLPTVPGTPAAS